MDGGGRITVALDRLQAEVKQKRQLCPVFQSRIACRPGAPAPVPAPPSNLGARERDAVGAICTPAPSSRSNLGARRHRRRCRPAPAPRLAVSPLQTPPRTIATVFIRKSSRVSAHPLKPLSGARHRPSANSFASYMRSWSGARCNVRNRASAPCQHCQDLGFGHACAFLGAILPCVAAGLAPLASAT